MSNKELEQRCTTLRHDLKAWEKNFASQHNGQRAGRDDIKADSVISQKYKEYNKLREILSGKIAPQTPSKRTASRKTSHHIECTPKANSRQAVATPLKRKREEELAVESVDSGAEFLSPQGPSVIGPTPQRDGIVLGLFDLLPQGTPSKQRKALGDVSLNVLQTPSKKPEKAESEASSLEPHARGEKTPLSSGKRFMLDTFVTPKKRKLEEEGTPTSTAKAFATPAFLRRNNALGAIDETDEPIPRPAPWKRGSLVRSLSSMIRSMQKQEDDRLDEEADIMREIELEEQGISLPKKPRIPKIQVEDSQAAMPLGPDRDLSDEDNESEANEELGPDGKPLRVWKKKGPKRQTRRVIMRPNFAKPKPPPTLARDEESEDEQSKTQDKRAPEENALSGDGFSEGDFDGSDYASDDSHTPKKRKTQHKTQDTSTSQPKQGKTTKMEAVKTAARKIKATAHANYRRLNIKSKAGNGGKGRFGRRR